jgi:hypothetical protein
MELRDFKKYLQGKSISEMLHRARKDSLDRILAHDELAKASPRQKPPPKRVATR